MRRKQDTNTTTLFELTERFRDEQACRDYLEGIRWQGGHITCPHCSSDRVHKFSDNKLYFCSNCRQQFTVTVGTIFEGSHIPLRKWFFAVYLITAHKKGISSLQLSRDIKVSQKTAWYMNHRIRYALTTKSFTRLSNTVEVDETYIGGKTRRLGDPPLTTGRGSERKTPVIGIVERNGNVIALPVRRITGKNLKRIVKQYVEVGSKVMTDEFPSYNALNKDFQHETVNHSAKEYARGEVYTNTIEGFFSLLKRGLTGIYHSVSPKHIPRYCNEFSFRCNTRRSKDSERFVIALNQCEGRLTYKTLIGAKQNEAIKKQAEAQPVKTS